MLVAIGLFATASAQVPNSEFLWPTALPIQNMGFFNQASLVEHSTKLQAYYRQNFINTPGFSGTRLGLGYEKENNRLVFSGFTSQFVSLGGASELNVKPFVGLHLKFTKLFIFGATASPTFHLYNLNYGSTGYSKLSANIDLGTFVKVAGFRFGLSTINTLDKTVHFRNNVDMQEKRAIQFSAQFTHGLIPNWKFTEQIFARNFGNVSSYQISVLGKRNDNLVLGMAYRAVVSPFTPSYGLNPISIIGGVNIGKKFTLLMAYDFPEKNRIYGGNLEFHLGIKNIN